MVELIDVEVIFVIVLFSICFFLFWELRLKFFFGDVFVFFFLVDEYWMRFYLV